MQVSWKVPVKDITAIYQRMGHFVPGPVLSHCMRNGFAGAQANARLGSQLFPVYASKVGLHASLLLYPLKCKGTLMPAAIPST